VATALRQWEAAQDQLAELRSLTFVDDPELRQLAADELAATTAQEGALVRRLTEALMPRHPFASMPCLIEIRPGPGGMEGRFFADSLCRMYRQYLARRGMRVKVVKYDVAEGMDGAAGESAVTEAVLEVEEAGAYDLLRGEAGMHRVQRVPVTESKGRTHTSAVAVWVLPAFPDVDRFGNSTEGVDDPEKAADFDDPESIFYINPAEVKQETMRAGGAGGQHVNKTESAIRLTHVPTNTTVTMQDSRSQVRNREKAWAILRARIAQQRREEREEQAMALRNSVLSKDRITRADKIRTYNYGQDRCTDHRSGLDVRNLPDVLEGGETLERVMESVRQWLVARDVRAMMADEEERAGQEEEEQKRKTVKK